MSSNRLAWAAVLSLYLTSGVSAQIATPLIAKAVIVDKAGNEYRSQTGDLVPVKQPLSTMLVFSAKKSVHGGKPSSVKWTVLPKAWDDLKWVPGDGQEFSLPTGDKPVLLTVILSVALGDTSDHTIVMIQCGEGGLPPPVPPIPIPIPVPPTPQPIPIPPLPVPPTPDPTPGKLSVLIIEDTEARAKLPQEQVTAMFSAETRDYLNAHCGLGTDGKTRNWRRLSVNTADVSKDAGWVQSAWQQYQTNSPTRSTPWIMVSNGVGGTSEPFPANQAALMTLLRKWGGN